MGILGDKGGVMRTLERTPEQRTRPGRNYTSIFFNLLALAILLTAIVVLHQILKKPAADEAAQVKSVAALPQAAQTAPAQPAVTEKTKEAVAVVELDQKTEEKKPAEETKDETVTFKEVKIKPQAGKKIIRKNQWSSKYAYEGPPVEELDDESARQKYLRDNTRLSKGIDTSPSRSSSRSYDSGQYDRRYSYGRSYPSVYNGSDSVDDLDSDAARRHYQEENKRLSRGLAYDPSKSRKSPNPENSSTYRSSEEYIPFESK
jgi:hypothetical protein